jgi:hypothetical protein
MKVLHIGSTKVIFNMSSGYCIVELNDMKYSLDMKALHKTKII